VTGLLSGETALVAGGASGLGLAVARRFVSEGAQVAVFDRATDKLAALVEEERAILAIPGDVRSPDDCTRAIHEVIATFGRLDSLLITVGIVDFVSSFQDYSATEFLAAFREVMDVNVAGPMTLALLASSLLEESRGNITFTLSTSAAFAPASGPVYGMSKAALVMGVKQLAIDLAPEVRVNGVVPGAVTDTDIRGPEVLGQMQMTSRLASPEGTEAARRASVLGIAPTGADYAGLYVLLASRRDGRVATGSVITWDGGTSLVGHGHLLERRRHGKEGTL
jgi:NAD(P)-dependent dehydrogenase (short-subunit alcohol dehydrogenase family)